jgi:sugar lactone lactonase YvrE
MSRSLKLCAVACAVASAGALAQTGTAVPGQKGGQDVHGAYEVANWPKDISTLPGHEDWTWGAGQGVFAESPDRVFVLVRGELPNIPTPETVRLPELGPSITFPLNRIPWRDATTASLPAALDGPTRPQHSVRGELGVDVRWEHCILVFDREGNLIEDWTQWDEMLRRPHAVYISPYDPEKHVWIVDDYRHAIFKFTNDGKELVQTIGEPNVHASDEGHFYRPTFMAFRSDGGFYVADGYANTRVVRFDAGGNYMMEWGQEGNEGRETRPGYFNNVHGIAIDPANNRVFVNDRDNHRVQVFTENGEYLDEWRFGGDPSNIHLFVITADRYLWAFDRGTHKMLKYDLDGNFLYSFGTFGGPEFAGGMWGVHGIAVDQEGNLYLSDVDRGGAQKYVPKPGARQEMLVGKPVYSAWE